MRERLLNFCKKEGILLDGVSLNFFLKLNDSSSVENFLIFIKNKIKKRFITKKIIMENKDILFNFFSLDKIKKIDTDKNTDKKINNKLKETEIGRKLLVSDFIIHYKERYNKMVELITNGKKINRLTSIGKILGSKQNASIIGMVFNKKYTNKNNLILEVEDLRNSIKIIFSPQNKELYTLAEDIPLDSVLGFSGVCIHDVFFPNEIIFPTTESNKIKNSKEDISALFIGDIHFGSKNFMKNGFKKFIDYLSEEGYHNSEAKKIKFLFIVGDLVSGIGNYPGQKKDLVIDNLKTQFVELSKMIQKIRSDIQIIISPGNHDCVRLMEPQPSLDKKFAEPLYNLKNTIFVENPFSINMGESGDFPGFNILGYHGFSFPYYANNIPSLISKDAINNPTEIAKYLMRFRHLAPTHESNQFFPTKKDSLLIREVPDIMVFGHTHKSGFSYEKNILFISVSSWEKMTAYQEERGNVPDYCKVPMFNLKTREIKILDFEVNENKK